MVFLITLYKCTRSFVTPHGTVNLISMVPVNLLMMLSMLDFFYVTFLITVLCSTSCHTLYRPVVIGACTLSNRYHYFRTGAVLWPDRCVPCYYCFIRLSLSHEMTEVHLALLYLGHGSSYWSDVLSEVHMGNMRNWVHVHFIFCISVHWIHC